jgi:transcriptional regulator with XRE-family HTH domain
MSPQTAGRKRRSRTPRDIRRPRANVPQSGAAIIALRKARDWETADLAAAVGCHPKALLHIERQSRGASDEMIRAIAAVLGVPTSEIRRPDDTGAAVLRASQEHASAEAGAA